MLIRSEGLKNMRDAKDAFEDKLHKKYDMEGFQRKHELFEKAWVDRHSDGLEAIEQEYKELVYLIRG